MRITQQILEKNKDLYDLLFSKLTISKSGRMHAQCKKNLYSILENNYNWIINQLDGDYNNIHLLLSNDIDKKYSVLLYLINNVLLTEIEIKNTLKNNLDHYKNIVYLSSLYNNKQLYHIKFLNSKEDYSIIIGNTFRGKKRPEHSLKLKGVKNIKNSKENPNFLTEKRKQYFSNFNDLQWKIKVMIKAYDKTIDYSKLSEEQILLHYSNYRKHVNNSVSYKKNRANLVLKSKKYSSYIEILDKIKLFLEQNDIENAYTLALSIISSHTSSNNSNMGSNKFYKKVEFNNLFTKKCIRNKITVRSSYEERFIEDFIFKNLDKIEYWNYEPITLLSNNLTYLPDFSIKIKDDKEYYVEIKGIVDPLKKDVKKYLDLDKLKENFIFIQGKVFDNIKIENFKNLVNMRLFQAEHSTKLENTNESRLGLSVEQIINTFEKDSHFVYNGPFIFKIADRFQDIKLFFILGNKCRSEIFYNIKNKEIYSYITSNRKIDENILEYFHEIESKLEKYNIPC